MVICSEIRGELRKAEGELKLLQAVEDKTPNQLKDQVSTKHVLNTNEIFTPLAENSAPLTDDQASHYAHEKFWPSCPQNLFASRDLY